MRFQKLSFNAWNGKLTKFSESEGTFWKSSKSNNSFRDFKRSLMATRSMLTVLPLVRLSQRLCKILVQFVTFRLFSGHLESVLHCPRQCLLSNIIYANQKPKQPIFSFLSDFLVEKKVHSYKTFYRTVILV